MHRKFKTKRKYEEENNKTETAAKAFTYYELCTVQHGARHNNNNKRMKKKKMMMMKIPRLSVFLRLCLTASYNICEKYAAYSIRAIGFSYLK